MIPTFLTSLGCLYLAREDHAKTGSAVLAVVETKDLVTMAEGFFAAGYYLEDISGLDVTEGAVSVYHFDHFDIPKGRVTVLALQPRDDATFLSIAGVYQGAEWHERETRDFYGYGYEGNPNLIPLLLPDNMADVHPLAREEGQRAPLRTFFGAGGRTRDVVARAESFSLLDAPAPEPETAPAGKAGAATGNAATQADPRKGGDDA